MTKKQQPEPRTRVEKLLMELLYQTLPCESSDNYLRSRLKKAGFTEEEIKETMENQ
jgi:hypothetical protein